MKILAMTFKELRIVLRDRTALLLMVVAPVALTMVLSFAFGRVSSGGLTQIPVVVVNHDSGALGQALVDLLGSDTLKELVVLTVLTDDPAARRQVDQADAAAAILIPAGLTDRVTAGTGDPAAVDVYTDPGRPVSSAVVRGIVDRFVQQVAAGALGAQVTVTQLVQSGRLAIADVAARGADIGARIALESVTRQLITVAGVTGSSTAAAPTFNYLQYYAPGMAIMFLMFAMASSARSLLSERETGTLARLRSTPTQAWELLGGKTAGVLATGLLQMGVLILITTLAMGVRWGDGLAVAALTFLTVAALAAMGLMLATVARTTNQANALGGAVTMVLAAAGGNFIPRLAFPAWLRTASLIGPNAWAIEGYQKLAAGGALGAVAPELLALAVLTLVFFGMAVLGFRRIVR